MFERCSCGAAIIARTKVRNLWRITHRHDVTPEDHNLGQYGGTAQVETNYEQTVGFTTERHAETTHS